MKKENQYRPKWHLTAPYGWINDPNGLVFHDGVYEVYYQHNPKDIVWGNMTWGHQRTADLVHFEPMPLALLPDEHGTMFSGCGFLNRRGLLGLPKDALIFIYTVAPPFTEKAEEREWFSIRLAYSLDGGKTLIKKEGAVLTSLGIANRDPKVFWHEETGAYVLVLWIQGNELGIFRSEDLTCFELSQRLTLEGAYECPDLFKLPVFDPSDQGDGAKHEPDSRWVFWAADGSYYVGDFDGYRFTETQERKQAYQTKLPYAAQTFSGLSGRVISLSWLRTENRGEDFTGMLSLPRELSLLFKDGQYILSQKLPEEVRKILQKESGEDPLSYIREEKGQEIVFDHGITEITSQDGTELTITQE